MTGEVFSVDGARHIVQKTARMVRPVLSKPRSRPAYTIVLLLLSVTLASIFSFTRLFGLVDTTYPSAVTTLTSLGLVARPNIRFVTIATEPTAGFCRLARSALANGITLDVLDAEGTFHGHHHKPNMIRVFLRKMNPNDLLVFVDGYDVIIQRSQEEFWDVYSKGFDRNSIVLAAQKSQGAFNAGTPAAETLAHLFPPDPKNPSMRFVNTGGLVGLKKHLRPLLLEYVKMPTEDEQARLSALAVDRRFPLVLDRLSALFYSMHDAYDDLVPDLSVKPPAGRQTVLWKNRNTNLVPWALHFNGMPKNLQQVWKGLNYEEVPVGHDQGYRLHQLVGPETFKNYNDVCTMNLNE